MKNYFKVWRCIRKTPLFSSSYYSTNYKIPKPFCAIYEAVFGILKENNPSLSFNTKKYYELNPDVKKAGFNALYHYLTFGRYEGRSYEDSTRLSTVSKCPYIGFFDDSWYSKMYITKEEQYLDKPIQHYLDYGWKRKNLPFSTFNIIKFYLDNPDCCIEPLNYWYVKRPETLYFKDNIYPELYFSNQMQFYAMQKLYIIQQNNRINKIIPPNINCKNLTMIFAPSMSN